MKGSLRSFQQSLLAWFEVEARDLPWRRTKDPYCVYLSEIMLQQTRVDQGTPYYERFLERFPTIESLAEADEEAVLKQWEGLGYYTRARNLHRTARIIVEQYGGRFPESPELLQMLPGIGKYTAGAVAYMLDSSQKAAGAHAAGQKCGAYVRLVLNNKDSISFAKLNSKSGNIDEIKWNDNNHGYFIDNRDNKKYKIIKIGNQVWMAENLSYNESIGCWAYENKQSNALIYGYLYTWESAKKACPNGWHLPSNEEWGELKIHLGGNNEIADGKMKEEGTSHWKGPNRDANNQSGFTALPGGIRTKGSFKGIGDMGVWWSATGNHFGDTKTAASMGLTFDNSSSSFGLIENGTTEGFSVRCIKD